MAFTPLVVSAPAPLELLEPPPPPPPLSPPPPQAARARAPTSAVTAAPTPKRPLMRPLLQGPTSRVVCNRFQEHSIETVKWARNLAVRPQAVKGRSLRPG